MTKPLFKVRAILLDHENGTKQYAFHLIERLDADGAACIRTWGKSRRLVTGAAIVGSYRTAHAEFEAYLGKKLRRGYSITTDNTVEVNEWVEVSRLIGPLAVQRLEKDPLHRKFISVDREFDGEPGASLKGRTPITDVPAPKAKPEPTPEPEDEGDPMEGVKETSRARVATEPTKEWGSW